MKRKLKAGIWVMMWVVMVVEQVPVRAVEEVGSGGGVGRSSGQEAEAGERGSIEGKKGKVGNILKAAEVGLEELKGSEGIVERSRQLFGEELWAVKSEEVEKEDEELLEALKGYGKKGEKSLEEYVKNNTQSRWGSSVKYRIGMEKKRQGYMGEAIEWMEKGWAEVKGSKEGSLGREVAKREVGEFVELSVKMDRQERVKAILEEVEGWELNTRNEELVRSAREGLWRISYEPEISHKCGAMALYRLREKLGIKEAYNEKIEREKSPRGGFSLKKVEEIAQGLGMKYQMAYREKGAEMIVPSVVHWKWKHYAAVGAEIARGVYEVEDPTFAARWESGVDVFDQEGSGYYLVPEGKLPPRWRKVSEKEGEKVFGKANSTSEGNNQNVASSEGGTNDQSPLEGTPQKSEACGMPRYRLQSMKCIVSIRDIPVDYEVPRGPQVPFGLEYTQRDRNKIASTAGIFGESSYVSDCGALGSGFEFDWEEYVHVKSTVPAQIPGAPPVLPVRSESFHGQGGIYREQGAAGYGGLYGSLNGAGDEMWGGPMMATSPLEPLNNGGYVRTYQDGSQVIYGFSEGAIIENNGIVKYHVSKMIDGYGNEVNFNWEADSELVNGEPSVQYNDPVQQPVIEKHSNVRLASIVDSLGQATEYHYYSDNQADGVWYYRVKEVVDPYGRKASFEYNEEGNLIGITDAAGMKSHFTRAGREVKEMITPYDKTVFESGQEYGPPNNHLLANGQPAPRTWKYVEASDMRGTQRMEYAEGAVNAPEEMPNVPGESFAAVTPKGNTYFWDRKAWAEHPGDYQYAKSTQWLFEQYNGEYRLSGYKGSEKMALESRVWYRYPGQSAGSRGVEGIVAGGPSVVAQVIDGVTLYKKMEYNELGNVTKVSDAKGRTSVYEYAANKIDVIAKKVMENGVLKTVSNLSGYNAQHLPSTISDAAGQTTTMSYNDDGQLTSVSEPGLTTTFSYNSEGYLVGIDPPGAESTTLTYDKGQIHTISDEDNYTVTMEYDALDRLTKVKYPDNTTQETIYHNLDPVWQKDVQGNWSHAYYQRPGQPVVLWDNSGNVTQMEWCSCGSLEKVIDPLGHATTWVRDLQGRQVGKVYAGGKTESWSYDSAGRVKTATSANGGIATYVYNNDSTLASMTFSNLALGSGSVYKIGFDYDANYARATTRYDYLVGGGFETTTYGYKGIGQLGAGALATVDGPLGDDTISYDYDELGRTVHYSVNGQNSNFGYDNLGRMATRSNPLGTFTNEYEGASELLTGVQYPNSLKRVYGYESILQGQRLQSIELQKAGSALSKHHFERDASGQITQWDQTTAGTTKSWLLDYDAENQLTRARKMGMGGVGGVLEKEYAYGYDAMGNRIWENEDNIVRSASYDSINALKSIVGGSGQVPLEGIVDKAAKVEVSGKAVAMDSSHVFKTSVPVIAGTNSILVKLTGANGAQSQNHVKFVTSGSGTQNLSYYASSGNLKSDGSSNYEWDGFDRLTKITKSNGEVVTMSYDGEGRMAQLNEPGASRQYLWVGNRMVREKGSEGNGLYEKRFYPQGFQVLQNGVTSNYYYGKDHLGSVREVYDAQGNVITRYDYTPYGERTKVYSAPGTNVESPFGFTGHYYNEKSGLALTRFRAYDPKLARWLSLDPIREAGGANLYAYVGNNPINAKDPLGLDAIQWDNFGTNEDLLKLAAVVQAIVAKYSPLVASAVGEVLVTSVIAAPMWMAAVTAKEGDAGALGYESVGELRNANRSDGPDPEKCEELLLEINRLHKQISALTGAVISGLMKEEYANKRIMDISDEIEKKANEFTQQCPDGKIPFSNFGSGSK